MSWYSQMFKSQEAARERNRREQRRHDLDLNRKHGIEFEARYKIEELEKEQRLIGKELEKIRQGVHKKPAHEDPKEEVTSRSPQNSRPHVLSVVSPRHVTTNPFTFPTSPYTAAGKDSSGTPRGAESLRDAIAYLQKHPSALESIVGAPTKNDSQPDSDNPDSKETFIPDYLQKLKEKASEKYNKYSTLLHSSSPVFLKRTSGGRQVPSQVTSNGEGRGVPNGEGRVVPSGEGRGVPKGESRWLPNGVGRGVPNGEGRAVPSGEGRAVPSGEGRAVPSGEGRAVLSGEGRGVPSGEGRGVPNGGGRVVPSGEGQTPRAPVAMATSEQAVDTSTPRPITKPAEIVTLATGMEASQENVKTSMTVSELQESKGKEKKPGQPKALFPDKHNPDGSLRTMHTIPPFEDRYEQAKNARYIRTREMMERDRELGPSEIFAKK